jgi:predicted metal-binding protein
MEMQPDQNDMIRDALASDAKYAVVAEVSCIVFHESFRAACKQNHCGKYNTNWMGPPAIGPIEELIKKVQKYGKGLLFQTVYQGSGSFDYKGMMEGVRLHEQVFRKLLERIKTNYDLKDILPLNAGCCSICKRCAYLDDEPCRYPDIAVSSVEAYGIDVTALEKACGIPYYNGKNTYSFVGLILFNA